MIIDSNTSVNEVKQTTNSVMKQSEQVMDAFMQRLEDGTFHQERTIGKDVSMNDEFVAS